MNEMSTVITDHIKYPLSPTYEDKANLRTQSLPTKLGVIDLGANSIHLCVVQVWEDSSHTTLHEERMQVRLGAPVFQQGSIDPQTQSRALAAIHKFKLSCLNHEVEAILAVATSALREATNSHEFIEQIKTETGIEVVVIPGREEARLTALAASHSLGLHHGRVLVIDVGGGTTELAWVEEGIPKHLFSLQMGPIRLLQQLHLPDPPMKEGLEELRKVIRKGLTPVFRMRPEPPQWTVATSGTALCLGDLCGTHERAMSGLEVRVIFKASLRNLLESLAEKTLDKRAEWLQTPYTSEEETEARNTYPERADSIIPGGMVFLTAMEELNLETLITGGKALREGIILDYLQREFHSTPTDRSENLMRMSVSGSQIDELDGGVHGTPSHEPIRQHGYRDIRSQNILKLARRYGYEQRHANQVLNLARSLFEQLRSLHWLGEEDRFYLESAALLHDIGYHIGTAYHHLHSQYLVKHSDLEGFHQMEIRLIGNLVRYHSHELPSLDDQDYGSLPDRMRRKIDLLAGILRVADGLDFTHMSQVKTLTVVADEGKLKLQVVVRNPIDLEIEETMAKGNLLCKALRVQLEICPKVTEL